MSIGVSTIRIHAEGVPGIRYPFTFSTESMPQAVLRASLPSLILYLYVSESSRRADGGQKKGQLWKQPTVNDCLPYEKEVVVGVFVFGIRAKTLSLVDDVKLHTCPLGSDTAFLSGYDLKDPDCALKRCPVADFVQKTH